ncbi:MAG: helix-turn-helix transcriptional regulator [Ruminiclostridium sp.]|nr:helix-turn-helix transcriptional regulator [Ruminiclostridium sp.]
MDKEIKKRGRPSKEKDYNSPFAVRLRELSSGMTQQEIADGVGVSRQNIGQFLLGNNQPDITTLEKLADYFNVSTDYLLCRTDIKTADTTVQDICEYTGLSEKALKNVVNMRKVEILANEPLRPDDWEQFKAQKDKSRLLILNKLLENRKLLRLLDDIKDLYGDGKPTDAKIAEIRSNKEKRKKFIDSISKSDMYRYRAVKVFEELLDSFDVRKTMPELARILNRLYLQEIVYGVDDFVKSFEDPCDDSTICLYNNELDGKDGE